MGGRRRLSAAAPRLLGRHSGPRGRAYRRAYNAFAAEFDLGSPLAKVEAGPAALAWCNLEAATEALETARHAREHGPGRRPSPRTIERLARRQGLADQSYAQALGQLRELVGASRKPASIADLVARQQDRA